MSASSCDGETLMRLCTTRKGARQTVLGAIREILIIGGGIP